MTVMTAIRTQSDFIYECRDQKNELQSCLCRNSAKLNCMAYTQCHKNV